MVGASVETEGYDADGASLRLPGDPAAVWPRQRRVRESARDSSRGGRILAADGSQHRRCIAPGRARPAGPEWISEFLAGQDRRLGPVAAPPHGLTLWRVGFAGDVLDDD